MEAENSYTGGLVAVNSGTIRDSYCLYTSAPKKMTRRFAGKNSGSITTSFLSSEGQICQRWDSQGVGAEGDIGSTREAIELGFDTEKTWRYAGNKCTLKFQDKNWNTGGTAKRPGGSKLVHIRSGNDLENLIKYVSEGDRRFLDSYIVLDTDIDMHGKQIAPIGANRQSAFCGVFDGCGHSIKNFKILGDKIGNHAFIAYLRGSVINLNIDCAVKGEGNVAGLCGVNEGTISCCGAVVELNGLGDKLHMGGLVAQNFGTIDRSYAASRVRVVPVPLIPLGVVASSIALMGIVAFLAIPASVAVDQVYAPIDSDKNQIVIPDEEPTSDDGAVNTFSFKFNETLHIDPSDGNVYINFENPSYASNKVVVRLEAETDSGERIVMAESGAIDPGHGLTHLRLNDDGYALVNSGVRSGFVVLTPYNTESDDKAMVDSELPVTIAIEEEG